MLSRYSSLRRMEEATAAMPANKGDGSLADVKQEEESMDVTSDPPNAAAQVPDPGGLQPMPLDPSMETAERLPLPAPDLPAAVVPGPRDVEVPAPAVSRSNSADSRVRGGVRCGECPGCKKEQDCETCEECLQKKSNGGDDGSSSCVARKCTNLQFDIPPMTSVAAAAAARPTRTRAAKKRPRSPHSSGRTSPKAAHVSSNLTAKGDIVHDQNGTGPLAPPVSLPPAPLVEREFPWPASLLEDGSLQQKRLKIVKEFASLSSSGATSSHMYGLELRRKLIGLCGRCGEGNQNGTETTDPGNIILLCDGEGCGQEFHMKCCTPPLLSIPKGSFYCFDCSAEGATQQLEDYLCQHEQSKDNHEDKERRKTTSKKNKQKTVSFADFLLREDMIEEMNENGPESSVGSETNRSRTSRQRGTENDGDDLRVPRSELEDVHGNEDALIGKPVRLYCPLGNNYHNGRILDIRPCPGDTLCLVWFPAGKDNRKSPVTAWIYLEEHSVAVATDALWGLFGNKPAVGGTPTKKKSGGGNKRLPQWMHAKLWRRTARELVPVVYLLDEEQNQIRFRQMNSLSDGTNEPVQGQSEQQPEARWGLVETFGTGTYELLNLGLETMADETAAAKPPNGRQPKGDFVDNPVVNAIVQVELQEQKRIRQWKQLPLQDPLHRNAVKSADEMALGPLDFQTPEQKLLVRPCALVSTGLDRSMILDLVSQKLSVPPSKDLAMSMVCEVVDCLPSTIRSITAKSRRSPNLL